MTPQDAAVRRYGESERHLRTMARRALQAGDGDGAREYLRIAHLVGVGMVREARGKAPDEWERQYPIWNLA